MQGVAKVNTIKASQLIKLLEEQGFRCAYSGRELTPETATVDHKHPISRGGENSLDNLAIVHMDVNTAKSSMTIDEFLQVCRDVVEHLGKVQ